MKLCECGCGEPAGVYSMTAKRGQPRRFILGHNSRGALHPSWKGGRTVHSQGYIQVRSPDHPRASNGYVFEHILVVEEAMGRPLRATAEVHHVNGDRADNRNANLVACHDSSYHKLLHMRQDALNACGNPDWLKCEVCQEYDDPEAMYVSHARTRRARHPACARAAYRRTA